MTEGDEWIDVKDADIRAARDYWRAARDRREPAERVLLLRDRMEKLWGIQARQIAREFQRQRWSA